MPLGINSLLEKIISDLDTKKKKKQKRNRKWAHAIKNISASYTTTEKVKMLRDVLQ